MTKAQRNKTPSSFRYLLRKQTSTINKLLGKRGRTKFKFLLIFASCRLFKGRGIASFFLLKLHFKREKDFCGVYYFWHILGKWPSLIAGKISNSLKNK